MECFGPQCAAKWLEWLESRATGVASVNGGGARPSAQGRLFDASPYNEESPAIRSLRELEAAFEHLEYAVFRRYENQLTRAERGRLENSIRNTLFKVERFLPNLDENERRPAERRWIAIKEKVDESRERSEKLRNQARRADLKLAQLANLNPEGFEEFVAELFEAIGYEVERVGGSGDEGVDLRMQRGPLRAIVQCKYHARGVVGSPELQKFLGTVHHTQSHKGFFVTTSTFSLPAERFATQHPMELIDGPRLVELVHQALGPVTRRDLEPTWF